MFFTVLCIHIWRRSALVLVCALVQSHVGRLLKQFNQLNQASLLRDPLNHSLLRDTVFKAMKRPLFRWCHAKGRKGVISFLGRYTSHMLFAYLPGTWIQTHNHTRTYSHTVTHSRINPVSRWLSRLWLSRRNCSFIASATAFCLAFNSKPS